LRRFWPFVSAVAGLLLIPGCGGRGGEAVVQQASSLAIRITWPKPTRVIPQAATAIHVEIDYASGAYAGQGVILTTINSPYNQNTSGVSTGSQGVTTVSNGNSTVTTVSLPVGTFLVNATATAPGSAPLAVGQSAPFTTTLGNTTNVSLTMASTIDHLNLAPTNSKVSIGGSVTLVATAVDASGAIVLTAPNPNFWQWKTSNPNVVSIAPNSTKPSNCVATGVGAQNGSDYGTITATYTEDPAHPNKTGSTNVWVRVVASLTLTGASTVNVGSTTQLTAAATDEFGNTINGVKLDWIVSGGGYLTVNQTGAVTGLEVGTETVYAQTAPGVATTTGLPIDASLPMTVVFEDVVYTGTYSYTGAVGDDGPSTWTVSVYPGGMSAEVEWLGWALDYAGTLDSSGNFDINDGGGGTEIKGNWSPTSITGGLTAQGQTNIQWEFNVGRSSNPHTRGPNHPSAVTALLPELGGPLPAPRRE